MVFWFIAPSIVAVHDIFRSRGLDYRLIGLGALAPAAHRRAVRILRVRALARSSRSRCMGLVMLAHHRTVAPAAPPAHLRADRLAVRARALGRVPARRLVPLAAARLGLPRRLADPADHDPRAARRGGLAVGVWAWGRFGLSDRATRDEFLRRGRLRERVRVIRLRPSRRDRGEPAAARARSRGPAAHRARRRGRRRRSRTGSRPPESRRVFTSPLAARARDRGADRGRASAPRSSSTTGSIELDYGEWDGKSFPDLPPETSSPRWRNDPTFAPPGGESLRAVGARGSPSFCTEMLDGPTVVAVSHVSPIKAAVAWALGAGEELGWRMFLDLASITRIGGPRRSGQPARLQRHVTPAGRARAGRD